MQTLSKAQVQNSLNNPNALIWLPVCTPSAKAFEFAIKQKHFTIPRPFQRSNADNRNPADYMYMGDVQRGSKLCHAFKHSMTREYIYVQFAEYGVGQSQIAVA